MATVIKRNVEPYVRPFHGLKALALPYLSKRATSKAPRRYTYTAAIDTPGNAINKYKSAAGRVV